MLTPDDPNWFSPTDAAITVDSADEIIWTETADVVVVGFGGAGVSAAIEAVDCGASVIAIDRFNGGGATQISGGVTYLGGGTKQQQEAGVEDNADEMFKYLQMETQGIVKDETLRHFCDTSVARQQWLEDNGVELNSSLSPIKTSYPGKDYFLYYSGNESVPEYAAKAKPAQRGHRASGEGSGGFSGPAFYDPLKKSALAKGVKLKAHSRAKRLIMDKSGEVLGVEIIHFPDGLAETRKHDRYSNIAAKVRLFAPPIAKKLARKMDEMEQGDCVVVERIRAVKGLILSTGGFINNRDMVSLYAQKYRPAMPLGATACDGSGIRLGQTADGQIKHMDKISAWRFINPPMAMAKSIIVNNQGERFCNEQVYGAKLGFHMVEECGGKATIITSKALIINSIKQLLERQTWYFQALPMLLTFLCRRVKGRTVEELATKCGFPKDALKATINDYNSGATGQQPDSLGKHKDFLCSLGNGPYYAFDISLTSPTLPCATITFGGLAVNEETGQVLNNNGDSIKGLYAAGRAAVGIPTNFYVSGLSIADCIYSGQRAGKHSANL